METFVTGAVTGVAAALLVLHLLAAADRRSQRERAEAERTVARLTRWPAGNLN